MALKQSQNSVGDFEVAEEIISLDCIASDDEKTLWQAVKKWRKMILYCVGLSSAILLYGYDLVIVGTISALPAFQRDFGERYGKAYIIPSLWLSLWNIASPLGIMVGAVAGGFSQDRWGRRLSLAFGSSISAIGITIMFVAYLPGDINARRGVFFAGKLLQGFSLGMVIATAQTYMSEILPARLRGPIIAFFPIFTLLGQLIGAVVIFTSQNLPGTKSYSVCFASQWPFSAVPIAMAIILPESPTFLVRRGDTTRAVKAQERLSPYGEKIDEAIELLRVSIENEQVESQSGYVDCFQGIHLRRSLIVMFSNTVPQIFGITLLSKASYFLQVVGMRTNHSFIFLILGIVMCLLANIGGIWTLSTFGRRTLFVGSLGITTILWLGMGIAGCFADPAIPWYTAVTMIVIIMVCGIGVWPASFAVSSETSSLHLRAKTQGVGWFVSGLTSGLMGFVLPYIFNPDEGNLRAKTGFVYVGLCSVGLLVSWLYIPEMKGRTQDQIDHMFSIRLPSRDFAAWAAETTEADIKT